MFYNDIHVNLRYEHEVFAFQDVDPNFFMANHKTFKNRKAILTVDGDFRAVVEAFVGPYTTEELTISCLYAALKNIDNSSMFLHQVLSKLKTHMGIDVDDAIPKSIGSIVDTELSINDVPVYYLCVMPVIGASPVKVTLYTANVHTNEPWAVSACVKFEFGMNGYISAEPVPEYATTDSYEGMMVDAFVRAFQKTYENTPEHAHVWAQAKRVFEIKLGEMISKQYVPSGHLPITGWAKPEPKAYAGATMSTGKDERVEELPGLDEMVKHPVDGRQGSLKHVIINLNDQHRWTREQIADWLDTLDIDLRFKNEQD